MQTDARAVACNVQTSARCGQGSPWGYAALFDEEIGD